VKFIFLLSSLVSLQANATWVSIKEAGSVIEKFHTDYEVLKNGAWTETVDYVIRVQSEDSKMNASLFPIEYNAFTDQVEVLEAYTQNGKEKIPVEPGNIEDRDKGEAKDYDVQKVRSVLFPRVEIGSKLHVRYRVKTSKPLVEDRWSTEVSVFPSYHVESFRMRVKSQLPLYFQVRDPLKFLIVKQTSPKTLEVRNRITLPGWVHAEKDPYFHPQNNGEVWISTQKEWPTFFSGLNKQYDDLLNVGYPEKLKPWIEQASKLKTTAEKIVFINEKVSKEFRYFGDWRRHNGGLVPRQLKEIEKSRYGDCKDLSSLVTSLLRGLKMDARVALVRRGENPWGEEPDYALPAVNHFNHAIVHVQEGDKTYWLDPTNPVTSLEPYPDVAGRPAWLMGAGGGFARIPQARPEQFVHVHNYEYRFQGEGRVKVKVDAMFEKLAPYNMANDLMTNSRTEVLTSTLDYFSEGQEVKSHRFLKEPMTGRTLRDMRVGLEYTAGKVTYKAGKADFWVIPDGFLQGAFYETNERESDIRISETPYIFKGIRRLKDTKLVQPLPEPCKVDSRWMSLERTVSIDGKDVVISQQIVLKKPYITKQEFKSAPFKKLQEDTKACFYRAGVLIEANTNKS
jgi:hypothetical protein